MSHHTPSSPSTDTRTSCVICKSEILAGAAMCPICKSYQSGWKRKLYYCATMAGLIAVTFSLLTYMVSTWPEIRRTFFWRDLVDITALDSKTKIVIYNSGDGKVFVSHLSLRSEKFGYSGAILINQSIESKSFLVHDLKTSTEDLSKWGTGNFTEDFWQKILLKWRLTENECIQWHFFHPDDPGYQTIKTFLGNGFREVPIDATLYFHSGHDGHRISRNLKLFAVPYLKRTGACGAPDAWLTLQQ